MLPHPSDRTILPAHLASSRLDNHSGKSMLLRTRQVFRVHKRPTPACSAVERSPAHTWRYLRKAADSGSTRDALSRGSHCWRTALGYYLTG